MNEFLEAVNDLNQELYEKFGDDYHYERQFNYTTDGSVDIVNFGEIMVYCSELDEREWIEEKNDYEPLKPFLKRMLSQEIDKLVEVKNAFNTKER
jgi:hypothetical protein